MKRLTLVLVVAALGCSGSEELGQPATLPLDSGWPVEAANDSAPLDGAVDSASGDATDSPDASPDAAAETGVDAADEPDAMFDAGPEAEVDAAPEAAPETGAEPAPEPQPEPQPEPSPEAGPEPTIEAAVEASVDAAPEAEAGPLPCPSGMKRLPLSCVDVYEVTNKQYGDWLATNPAPAQPAECAWNASLVPVFAWPVAPGVDWQRPVAWVDWCDAHAYCATNGKRLCSKTEWLDACTSGGENTYTWGDGWYWGRCVTPPANYPKTQTVGFRPECQSTDPAYAGVFDLTGNVWEWTSECSGGKCSARGSAFEGVGSAAAVACDAPWPIDTNIASQTIGFRCCAD